jgi:tetratricopeptide (TPR) repeat protein
MSTHSTLETLERTSRTSAILMGLGALVVGGALWMATARLKSTQAEVANLEVHSAELKAKNSELQASANELTASTAALKSEAAGLRQALSASRNAIAAFHARDYAAAVGLYNEALASDPGNAYLINLKAYALFKLGQVSEAIDVQRRGLEIDPAYTWGLFDLARFQCAAGDKAAAARSLAAAETKEARFRELASADGEFARLCGHL